MNRENKQIENFCDAHSGMENRLKNLEDSDSKQWITIDQLRNRLPVWGTVIISLLTFLLGCALTFAGMIYKFEGK
jgi:hypothetical protein